MFTLEDIKNYEGFLSTVYKLVFSGGTAEPLLNGNFGEFTKYLKEKYGTLMTVNTNGSMITPALADILVGIGFDKLLVSYHAGSKEGYKNLMTGNVDRVDDNLRYLKNRKAKMGRNKPEIQFNFALQKLNQKEATYVIDKANELGIDSVLVSKYYGGRNKLQDQNVAFDYDTEEGNRILDQVYDYAKKKKVSLSPPKPSYWTRESVRWDPENYDTHKICLLPWIHLHFKPVPDCKNSHYVGVCNRIEIFKIDYGKVRLRDKNEFDVLWNHPILQHLRRTVNNNGCINPICKYCKNYDREMIRNVDADKYAEVRDLAQKDFLNEIRREMRLPEIDGIEILMENPHLDQRFKSSADLSGK